MTWFHAVLLGIMEGLTEFLPVSSTGHLILLSDRLGLHGDATKAFDVVIQLGAILGVVVYFRARLLGVARGVLRKPPEGGRGRLGLVVGFLRGEPARDEAESSARLGLALFVAFLPAAVVGLSVNKIIKARLFGPVPVAIGFVVGGVLMIAVEEVRMRRRLSGVEGLEKVSLRRSLAVGFAQCLSLWPGASRSMCTIVGGELTGLGIATAAEFSFLLAVPVLGAATVYDMAKHRKELFAAHGSAVNLAIGLTVSFVVALLVISGFLRYLKRAGLAPFGLYRIVFGSLLLISAFMHPPPALPEETSAPAPSQRSVPWGRFQPGPEETAPAPAAATAKAAEPP
jgi:undecaprenyl-diphosphatase